jgi:hypothetical protein
MASWEEVPTKSLPAILIVTATTTSQARISPIGAAPASDERAATARRCDQEASLSAVRELGGLQGRQDRGRLAHADHARILLRRSSSHWPSSGGIA